MEIDSVSKSCRNKTKIKKKRSGKKLCTMIFDKTYLFCIVLKRKGLQFLDTIPKICKSKLKKDGGGRGITVLCFLRRIVKITYAINIYFQMFYLALTSCLFTLALGFVAHESHAHAHLPGFCNNLDCPRFSVLQTYKVNKCVYISHNQCLIFPSYRIAFILLLLFFFWNLYFLLFDQPKRVFLISYFIEGRV